jgi:uncharacterized DUF497 family protein
MATTFEWDESKNRTNLTKHGVSFETAALIFDDPLAISFPERVVAGEERWQTIGSVDGALILVVAHTVRSENSDEVIRIISARKATPSERKRYEKSSES